jgi:hypothetical protein
MSVRAPGRAGEIADGHGQRPCEPVTSTNAYPEWFLLTSRTEVTCRMLIFS